MIPQYKKRNKNLFQYTIDSFTEVEDYDCKIGTCTISCPAGFGYSVGNALRRSILSNTSGCAIVAVKIDNCDSPFSTMYGVDKAMNLIIDSLSTLQCEIVGDNDYVVASFTKEQKDMLTLKADMLQSSNLVIHNPDVTICNINNVVFNISVLVARGYGYINEHDQRNFFSAVSGWFPISSIFSPVLTVSYDVVSSGIDEVITMKVSTHKYCDSRAVVEEAVVDLSSVFGGSFESAQKSEEIYDDSILDLVLRELDGLLSRTVNALELQSIFTIRDLLSISPNVLSSCAGIGEKAMEDIGSFLSLNIDVNQLDKSSPMSDNARAYVAIFENKVKNNEKKKKKDENGGDE